MKIFLDDVRDPKDCLSYMYRRIGTLNPIYGEEWLIVRNYDQFIKVITNHFDQITHVSFDHDLADEHYNPQMFNNNGDYNHLYDNFKEKSGLECAIWMKKFYDENDKKLPIMFVHSMNPVGTQNIINVFKS